jgi:hypothetical protein
MYMSSRRLAAALACVLLVATAGCGGLAGSNGEPTDQPTETVETTEAVDTETTTGATTTAPEQLAPGLTSTGVTDALALADAHREYVRTHSFVKHDSVQRRNATTRASRNLTLAYANQSRWLWNVSADGMPLALGATNGTFEQYADGERVLYALRTDGTLSYGVRAFAADGERVPVPPSEVFPPSTYERNLVYALFANADVTVERGDDAAARVTGTAAELTIGGDAVSDVEFTATVTADGLVRSLDLACEQGDATVQRSLAFDATASDPVERPDWYETAVNRTAA